MEIICIDDNFSGPQMDIIPNRPVRNQIYTVRDMFVTSDGRKAIHLKEIENPHIEHDSGLGMFEPSFAARRFTTLLGEPIRKEANKVNEPY